MTGSCMVSSSYGAVGKPVVHLGFLGLFNSLGIYMSGSNTALLGSVGDNPFTILPA
jgi:hypothetical protein